MVSGLPRSGTSMLMQMLDSGGVPTLKDDIRVADIDNPRGYFEFEPVKTTRFDCSWLNQANGFAVKAIYLLLYDLPESHNYRVVLCRRNIAEVMASQKKMLERLGRPLVAPEETIAALSLRGIERAVQWLRTKSNFRLLEVEYLACIQRPSEVASALSAFLGGGLRVEDMARVPDRALYRQERTQKSGVI